MTQDRISTDALTDPRSAYPSPEYLAKSDLSHAQKIRLLERWKSDEEALLRAAGEGMSGGEQPMIVRVDRALEELRAYEG